MCYMFTWVAPGSENDHAKNIWGVYMQNHQTHLALSIYQEMTPIYLLMPTCCSDVYPHDTNECYRSQNYLTDKE